MSALPPRVSYRASTLWTRPISTRRYWSVAGATTASHSKDRSGVSLTSTPVRDRASSSATLPSTEGKQVTCPQGKTSVTWRAGRDEVGAPRITAVFSRTDCGTCTVRPLCTTAKDARRSLYFHPRPEYEALNAARARMHDAAAWKQQYHVRAGIEGTLSQGVRA